VFNPNERIFLAAFSSRSKMQPHLHLCVLVLRAFFTLAPQLEQLIEIVKIQNHFFENNFFDTMTVYFLANYLN